jgi:basic membrane protein A and related proteins
MHSRTSKSRGLLALIAVAVLAAVVAGCGGSDDKSSSTSTGGAAKKNVKVAILSTGAVNNRSWANSWADGAKKAATDLGATVTMVGNVETPDQYTSQGASFAAKGYNVIIFAHGAMNDPAVKLAKQFPNVKFVQAPFEFATAKDQAAQPANLGHVDFKQEQGSFLAGAMAGFATKTNKVGAIYAFPFPALTRQTEAFGIGARCTNPKVTFTQKATNSFTDAGLARAAASSMYDSGIDVIFSAVDQAVQGIIAAANNSSTKPAYVVAQYRDQHSLGKNVVLTSVQYNLNGVAEDIVKAATENKIGSHYFKSYDLQNLNVGTLAPLQNLAKALTPEETKQMAQITAAVKSGQIKVPDAVTGNPTIGKLNSGEKIDPKSIGCTTDMQKQS